MADVAPDPPATSQVRADIRALRGQRSLAVIDDDPTGSQAVHDVQLVTALDSAEYAGALERPGSTAFVLTNSRSLSGPDAREVTGRVARDLHDLAARRGRPIDLVSRSDSTLRGHVMAEVAELDAAQRTATGSGYDAILFAPGFFEAGRATRDDEHRVRVGDEVMPVAETEYARDATFGYRSSNLRDFVSEVSAGAIPREAVWSISLADIRDRGVAHVESMLRAATGGRFVVVNGERDDDYDVVALAAARAVDGGTRLLYRTGPSFVRALAGIEPSGPVDTPTIWAGGRRPGHGLVVVGSHVAGTSVQVERLLEDSPARAVELDVRQVMAGSAAGAIEVARRTTEVLSGLADEDVVLVTSRDVVLGTGAEDSLRISREVSAALTDVVRAVVDRAAPAWVIGKGGITSHDVAVQALGIRRAQVVGQMEPGIISLLRPVVARQAVVGMPYVVFAGNVGSANSLARVVSTLNGGRRRPVGERPAEEQREQVAPGTATRGET